PPDPKITNLPVRVNLGEKEQRLKLEGTGLDRVESVTTPAGTVTGSGEAGEWSGKLQLNAAAQIGQRFPVVMKVKGLEDPLTAPNAIEVVGARPAIAGVRKSLQGNLGVDLREDELPAGITLGLVLTVKNLRGRPVVDLGCESEGLRHARRLSPDEPSAGAALSFAGPGELYLSFDPGSVGYPGCNISA